MIPRFTALSIVHRFTALSIRHRFTALCCLWFELIGSLQLCDLCDLELRPSMTSPAPRLSSKTRALHRICLSCSFAPCATFSLTCFSSCSHWFSLPSFDRIIIYVALLAWLFYIAWQRTFVPYADHIIYIALLACCMCISFHCTIYHIIHDI